MLGTVVDLRFSPHSLQCNPYVKLSANYERCKLSLKGLLPPLLLVSFSLFEFYASIGLV